MILVHYLFSEACCLRHFLQFPNIEEQCRYEIIVEVFGYYSWSEFEFVVLNQDLYTELFSPGQLYLAYCFCMRYYRLAEDLNKTCFYY